MVQHDEATTDLEQIVNHMTEGHEVRGAPGGSAARSE
jgi:hypothetical protein